MFQNSRPKMREIKDIWKNPKIILIGGQSRMNSKILDNCF